jgi:hypothetical protein
MVSIVEVVVPYLVNQSIIATGSSTVLPDAMAISSAVIFSSDHFFIARYIQYIDWNADLRLAINPVK